MDLLSVALTARFGSFGLSCFPIEFWLMVRLFNGIHLHSIDSHCAIWMSEWNTRTEFHRYFHIFYAGMKSSFIPLKWGGGGICVHSYEIKWFYKTAPNSDASPHELITIINQANRELKILLFPLIQPSSM